MGIVAVTGATGHLGHALVARLAASGQPVRAIGPEPLDRPFPGIDLPGVVRVRADVRDYDALLDVVEGATTVFHLAGRVSLAARDGLVGPVNVGGTANVVDACAHHGVARLVHVSSIHALVGTGAPYDRSKAKGEAVVRAAAGSGLDAVVCNPTGIVGPGDPGRNNLNAMLLDLWRGRLPAIVPGGFDWVDVRDVADGLLLAADEGVAGHSYLLAGHWTTVRELVDLASAVAGRRPPRVTLPNVVVRAAAAVAEPLTRYTRRPQRFTPAAMESLRILPEGHRPGSTLPGHRARPLEETIRDTYEWAVADGRL